MSGYNGGPKCTTQESRIKVMGLLLQEQYRQQYRSNRQENVVYNTGKSSGYTEKQNKGTLESESTWSYNNLAENK